jgi:hypothetical protein
MVVVVAQNHLGNKPIMVRFNSFKNFFFYSVLLLTSVLFLTTDMQYVNKSFRVLELVLILLVYLNQKKYKLKKLPLPIIIFCVIRIFTHYSNPFCEHENNQLKL